MLNCYIEVLHCSRLELGQGLGVVLSGEWIGV
jgi:hypothetical protein